MRWSLMLSRTALDLGLANAPAHGGNANPSKAPRTFAIETFVGRTYNYLDTMVDKDGLPYFNIFWTDPAEAAHDWPDFGDVTSRQLQGAIMARHLTGKEAAQREALDEEGPVLPRSRRRACWSGRRPPSPSRWPTWATRPSRSTPW